MLDRTRKVVLGLLALAMPMLASAQAIDVTSVITQIGLAATAVLAVGAAIVAGPKIAVAVYKWVGRAL